MRDTRPCRDAPPTDDDGVCGGASPSQQVMISPYATFLLKHQNKTSAHTQMESWGAVGCYLSHIRCWDWLLAQPSSIRCMLVLEDDACFDPEFASVWRSKMEPLCHRAYPTWDVVLLGFFEVHGDVPAVVDGITVRKIGPGGSFFGTHGYLVTRRGAARLRERAFLIAPPSRPVDFGSGSGPSRCRLRPTC